MAITLGILAAIFTALALWIGLKNEEAKKEQVKYLGIEKKDNENNLKTKKNLDEKIKGQNEAYFASIESIDKKLAERDQKEAEKLGLESDLAALKTNVEDLSNRLADFKAKIPDVGAVETLISDLQRAKEAIASTETQIDELNTANAILNDEITKQNDKIAYQVKWIGNHSAYQAQESLSASINAVYSNWGFVVVDAGDVQGVTPKSYLVVKRGEEYICDLVVKTTTNGAATAEIVQSTLVDGEYVQVGDNVTAKPPNAKVEEVAETEAPVNEQESAETANEVLVDPFSSESTPSIQNPFE
ncbi:hypothetical protein OAB00_02570 [Akkermansiaceae bacterium]|nr:hypothetical protein [Akkermansiaceae bacterium]